MGLPNIFITHEMCRREAVVYLWDIFGHKPGIDQATQFRSALDVLNDRMALRLDYKNEIVTDEAPDEFFTWSIDQASVFIRRMIRWLPSVQIARRRQFKLRKMKARAKARTWKMPWLRRKNIWIGA